MMYTQSQINVWRDELFAVLKLSSFLKWLLEKQPDEVVGYAWDCDRCPIRNYLSEKVPHLDVEVGTAEIRTTNIPTWRWGGRQMISWVTLRGFESNKDSDFLFNVAREIDRGHDKPHAVTAAEVVDAIAAVALS